MHKWLAPSSIQFLQMHRQLTDDSDDNLVIEFSHKLMANELAIKVPKMQVSEKDGKMYALNNSSLQLMRQLEKQGKLQKGLIQVEVVPLSKVPANIQRSMIVESELGYHDDCRTDGIDSALDEDDCKAESSKSNVNKKGCYHKLHSESVNAPTISMVNNSIGIIGPISAANNTTTHTSDDSDHETDDEEDGEDIDDNSSDSSTSSETLQCNVCDHSFSNARQLATHQLNKKHFGCSVCDTVFPSLTALEEHKETLEHWSDTDNNEQSDEDNEQQNQISRPLKEELERLL